MTNKIDITKNYKTRSGFPVMIYAVNMGNKEYKIHGAYFEDNEWQVASWDKNGRYHDNTIDDDLDLIEVGKYDNIKIDDRVICCDKDNLKVKVIGHFAGLTLGGRPRIYGGGRTSFTVKNKHSGFRIFDNCELYIEDKVNK